jgi:hypothetical protein
MVLRNIDRQQSLKLVKCQITENTKKDYHFYTALIMSRKRVKVKSNFVPLIF